MYYTYTIYDKIDKKFYIGFTRNLQSRIKEHLRGNSNTTKKYKSLELVYYEVCVSKLDAEKRERQLKTGFGRGYLKKRIENYLKNLGS